LPANNNRHFQLSAENAGDRKILLLVKEILDEARNPTHSEDHSRLFQYT